MAGGFPIVHADEVEVKITGVEGPLLSNIVAFMTYFQRSEAETGPLAIFNLKKPPRIDLPLPQIERAHKLAAKEIKLALQPFGYYDTEVSDSLMKTEKGWSAVYAVMLGKAASLGGVDIQISGDGKNDVAIQKARSKNPLNVGSQLSHPDYEKTKTALLDAAFQSGYLDAGYSRSEIRVVPGSYVADITLHLDTGPLFYFGDIVFEQSALETAIINRFLPFKKGDPFDAAKLSTLQLRLEDTEYFNEIEVDALRDNAVDNRIPVTITATASKPRSYSIGAGYGTDTGPRVNAGLINRLVNKKGHQLRGDVRVSAISASVQTQYQIPINRGTKDHIAITAAASKEQVADTDTDSILLGIGRYESWRGFQRQLYLNYESEDFEVGGQSQSIELLIPGISLSKKVSDNLVYPRNGYSLEFDLHGATDSALSDTSFLQGSLSAATIFPLGDRGRILLRGEFGATEADNFDLLPFSQRFFNGGDRSVRGFDFQEISPVNDDGERIGGRYLSTFSIETDYLVYNDYGIAAFIDAGNASESAFSDLKVSAGLGFRYRSPIGMIRLDVARPVSEEDQSFRLHVSIGADL